MLDRVLEVVGSLGPWAYLIVFLLIFLESAAVIGFLVPGVTTGIFCGFLAGQGVLRLEVLLTVVATAAIGGNLVGYQFGRRLHRPWVLHHGGRLGLHAEHLRRVEAFFHRHGGKAVLFGRFMPVVRALVPFVAGASNLYYPAFVFYTVVGGVVWSSGIVLIGYTAGKNWHRVEHWLARLGLATFALVAPSPFLRFGSGGDGGRGDATWSSARKVAFRSAKAAFLSRSVTIHGVESSRHTPCAAPSSEIRKAGRHTECACCRRAARERLPPSERRLWRSANGCAAIDGQSGPPLE